MISLNPRSCQKAAKKTSYAKTNDRFNSLIPLTVMGQLAPPSQ